MIAEGGLLEYAEVYGNYYGTPRDYVMDLLNQGKDVILEIDIQGALQIKKRFPDGVFVFIVPPSLDELSSRIYKRGTDSEEVIKKRLASATGELAYASEYDYIIVNDIAERATQKVLTVMEAEATAPPVHILLLTKFAIAEKRSDFNVYGRSFHRLFNRKS